MFSPFLFIFWFLFLEPYPHFPEINLTDRLINVDVISEHGELYRVSCEVKYEGTGKEREEKEGLNKRRSKKIGEYWEEGETKTRFKKTDPTKETHEQLTQMRNKTI